MVRLREKPDKDDLFDFGCGRRRGGATGARNQRRLAVRGRKVGESEETTTFHQFPREDGSAHNVQQHGQSVSKHYYRIYL